MAKTEPEQIALLAQRLLNTGQPPSNGFDPGDFDGPRRLIAWALQQGRPPQEIAKLIDPPLLQAIIACDPTAPLLPPLHTISALDLLTRTWPDPVWLIPNLLPVGLTILAGKPKVGKSWMALQIAQAVATGGKALGLDVARGPVLYLALEDNPRRIASRMKAQGWPPGNAGIAEFCYLTDFMRDIEDLARGAGKLADQMKLLGCRLCVIDTMGRAIQGDPDKARDMIPALSPIQAVALDLEAGVLIIDHHHKATGQDPDPVLDVAGSVAKGGVADGVWGLYREQGKAGARLHILGRDVDEREIALHFDPLTMCWQPDDTQGPRLNETRQAILDYLQAQGPAGIVDLAEASGQNKGTAYREVNALVASGQVKRLPGDGRSVLYSVEV